jgi:hypothetical protein
MLLKKAFQDKEFRPLCTDEIILKYAKNSASFDTHGPYLDKKNVDPYVLHATKGNDHCDKGRLISETVFAISQTFARIHQISACLCPNFNTNPPQSLRGESTKFHDTKFGDRKFRETFLARFRKYRPADVTCSN